MCTCVRKWRCIYLTKEADDAAAEEATLASLLERKHALHRDAAATQGAVSALAAQLGCLRREVDQLGEHTTTITTTTTTGGGGDGVGGGGGEGGGGGYSLVMLVSDPPSPSSGW